MYTYDELKTKTVAQLREICDGLEGEQAEKVKGYKTLHKEEVIKVLCDALGIEAHEHHEVVGLDKKKVKAQIQEQKEKRKAALEAKDPAQLKRARLNIRRLKHKIRKATV